MIAQTIVATASLDAETRFTIADKEVTGISEDATAGNKRMDKLITEKAAKEYADISGGGASGTYIDLVGTEWDFGDSPKVKTIVTGPTNFTLINTVSGESEGLFAITQLAGSDFAVTINGQTITLATDVTNPTITLIGFSNLGDIAGELPIFRARYHVFRHC